MNSHFSRYILKRRSFAFSVCFEIAAIFLPSFVRQVRKPNSRVMRLDFLFITYLITKTIASPFISNLADKSNTTGYQAIPALSRELIQISENVEGAHSRYSPRAIDIDVTQFPIPPLEAVTTEVVGNAAIWQEAVGNDARVNANEGTNQYFFRLLNFFQNAEFNTSLAFETRVLIARGLQYLQLYPARFDQAQAAVPADSLGR